MYVYIYIYKKLDIYIHYKAIMKLATIHIQGYLSIMFTQNAEIIRV